MISSFQLLLLSNYNAITAVKPSSFIAAATTKTETKRTIFHRRRRVVSVLNIGTILSAAFVLLTIITSSPPVVEAVTTSSSRNNTNQKRNILKIRSLSNNNRLNPKMEATKTTPISSKSTSSNDNNASTNIVTTNHGNKNNAPTTVRRTTTTTMPITKSSFVRDPIYMYSSLMAGIGSGIVSGIACAPLDLIKTRMQIWGSIVGASGTTTATSRSSIGTIVHMLRDIVRTEGITGCFRGLGATLITVPAFWGVYCKLTHVYTSIVLFHRIPPRKAKKRQNRKAF